MGRLLKPALFSAPCDTHSLSVFTGSHYAADIMVFTHDDRVERVDPAIVWASSFLIFACGRRSFDLRLHNMSQMGHHAGHRSLVSAKRREITPRVSLLSFYSSKCWLGAVPVSISFFFFCLFMSLPVWKIHGLFVIGCARLSQQECEEKRGALQTHPDGLHYSQCKRAAC